MSKFIKSHRAVLECDRGADSGVDYKYDVLLKEDYRFSSGRMEGSRVGHFRSVEEFRDAKPKKVVVDF